MQKTDTLIQASNWGTLFIAGFDSFPDASYGSILHILEMNAINTCMYAHIRVRRAWSILTKEVIHINIHDPAFSIMPACDILLIFKLDEYFNNTILLINLICCWLA